jgi:hypothetical protein
LVSLHTHTRQGLQVCGAVGIGNWDKIVSPSLYVLYWETYRSRYAYFAGEIINGALRCGREMLCGWLVRRKDVNALNSNS